MIKMPHPKVTIIILNWNGKEDTIECLESLKHITYPNYEILLVDNGSTDGSVECFRERYPGMEIIETGENLGFAEGNNVGFRRAMDEGADYVLLLNNDTVVDPEFLGELVKVAEGDERIGIVGAINYYYDKPEKIWFCGGKINFWNAKVHGIGVNEMEKGQYDRIREVDYVAGSCFLIEKEVIKIVGILDHEYFAFWEETDLCVRAHKAGYKVVYVPKAKIWHKVSSTAKKISGLSEYYITRNRFLFMKKNATRIQFISFMLWFSIINFWFMSGLLLYKKNMKTLICFHRGIKDGLLYVMKD